MAELVHLADETNDNTTRADVIRRLRLLADDLESGADDFSANKALVVLIEDDGAFHYGFRNIGLSMPEIVSAAAIAQALALRDLS